MRQYIDLLRRHKNFKILIFVQFITYFGAWFSQIGVSAMLLNFDFSLFDWEFFGYSFEHESIKKWAISFAAVFSFLPSIFLAPISGILIDSFKSKKLLLSMITVELFSVLMLLFITDASYIFYLFILIFIRLSVASIYFQTQMSLVAGIFNKEDLKLANELYSLVWAVSYTAGMASAGFFIHYFGEYAAFSFDCFLFWIGIILLCLVDIKVENPKFYFKNVNKMAKEGLVYILKNPKLIHLSLLHAFVGITAYDTLVNFLAGYDYINKVYFFKELLSVALIIGCINSVRAFSLIIGPFVLSKYINNKTLFYVFLAQGFGIICWALLQFNFWLSLIGLVLTGFFTNTIWSYTYTAIQSACSKEYHGRVIAYVDMIFMSFSLIASLLTGYVFNKGISTFSITLSLGIAFILGAFYWKIYIRKYECEK